MTSTYVIQPRVEQAREFLEIARDFTNPLEAVREAISNSFDAGAKQIRVLFRVEQRQGEGELVVVLQDNGSGMDAEGLQSFFDLGNSLSRHRSDAIGAKGHGTKVFLGCDRLEVETIGQDRVPRRAVMERPLHALWEGRIPSVAVEEHVQLEISVGTRILLRGFNRNRRDIFTHDQVKDYVLWFTKFGGVDNEFGIRDHADKKLLLQGVDRGEPEILSFGHVFPPETKNTDELFDTYLTDAPKHFVKRWCRTGNLINHPEIAYQAVFYIEGDSAKRSYNPMLAARWRKKRTGAYKVTERYGLYLCKDFIPIERTVGWLGSRSTDHLLYHAFINCQQFQLTANRGSVANTSQPIMDDIREAVEDIRREIIDSDEFDAMSFLEHEASGYDTAMREQKQYKKRVALIAQQRVAHFNGIELIEPRQESGVFALVTQLAAVKPDAFPFEIVDYDTTVGMDALAKTRDRVAVGQTELRYIEFKFLLKPDMNHTFDQMHSIVAWDLHPSVRHESHLSDVLSQKRTFKIEPPDKPGDRTRYYLDSSKNSHKIEAFVLKTYLKETLGLDFKPRAR